jgi:hypothetical protein
MRAPLIIFFITYHQLSFAQYVSCNSEFPPPTISNQSICNNENAQLVSEIATSEMNSEKAYENADRASEIETLSDINAEKAYENAYENDERALLSNKYYQEALQKANRQ